MACPDGLDVLAREVQRAVARRDLLTAQMTAVAGIEVPHRAAAEKPPISPSCCKSTSAVTGACNNSQADKPLGFCFEIPICLRAYAPCARGRWWLSRRS